MSSRTSADCGPLLRRIFRFSLNSASICIIVGHSLGLPRSCLQVLTNTMSREYIPQCGFEGSRSFWGSLLWLFALLQGKLLPKDNQGSKESLRSARPTRGQSERTRLPRCRWQMPRLSWKTKAAKSRHLLQTTTDVFGWCCRPVITKFPSKEGNLASAVSGLSKSTLSQVK